MTKNTLENTLNEVFNKFGKDRISAVYLTGSRLNNLFTAESDYDLYVVLKQSKENLVFGVYESGQLTGEHDFKYMESYKFLQLIFKSNPNMTEMFTKGPLYVSEEFAELASYLYAHSEDLAYINPRRYFSGGYHLLKNNYNKLKNGSGKVAKARAGKEVANFYKTYYQLVALANKEDFKETVFLTGERREFLLNLKKVETFTAEERAELLEDMENKLDELLLIKEKFTDVDMNKEVVSALINLLPEGV